MSNDKVFISHSSEDRKTAIALCNYLESRSITCWMAPRNINVGKDYAQSIMEAIESSAIMILILTDAANNSKHVRNEIERSFNHQLVIMPFRMQNIMPGRSLEYFLSATHWLDAFDDKPEKYFPLLYQNCKNILQADATASPVQANIITTKPASNQSKKYLLIALIGLIALTGIIFLFQNINHKKSGTADEKILNADSVITKINDSVLPAKNKDSNKVKQNSVLPDNSIKATAKKKNEKNTDDADDQEEIASAHLPASVNGVYQDAVKNYDLTLSNSGDFSGSIQNKPVAGRLKLISGRNYRMSGYNISGSISFGSDYNSFSGSVTFKDLSVTTSFNMVKQ